MSHAQPAGKSHAEKLLTAWSRINRGKRKLKFCISSFNIFSLTIQPVHLNISPNAAHENDTAIRFPCHLPQAIHLVQPSRRNLHLPKIIYEDPVMISFMIPHRLPHHVN